MIRITSLDRNFMQVRGLPFGETIEWCRGSGCAEVYNGAGSLVDSFTFASAKNHPTMLDFTESLYAYLDYYYEEHEYA